MIRSQVPQKDPGRPALITNIAKVQAPQGGETPVPSAPQLGISGSGFGLRVPVFGALRARIAYAGFP